MSDVTHIAEPTRMTKKELVSAWQALFGEAPANATSRELLAYVVAWELQARREGGLDPRTKRRLVRLAEAFDAGRTPRSVASGARLRPGTTLVKQWRGRSYAVMALEEGFVFEGRTYSSLSEVARKISGTRWNGPAFFGLRKGRGAPAEITGDGE